MDHKYQQRPCRGDQGLDATVPLQSLTFRYVKVPALTQYVQIRFRMKGDVGSVFVMVP